MMTNWKGYKLHKVALPPKQMCFLSPKFANTVMPNGIQEDHHNKQFVTRVCNRSLKICKFLHHDYHYLWITMDTMRSLNVIMQYLYPLRVATNIFSKYNYFADSPFWLHCLVRVVGQNANVSSSVDSITVPLFTNSEKAKMKTSVQNWWTQDQGSLLFPKIEFFIKGDIWGWSFFSGGDL